MEWQMEPTILPSLLIQVKLENSILGKHEISLTHLLVENGSQGRPPGYTELRKSFPALTFYTCIREIIKLKYRVDGI